MAARPLLKVGEPVQQRSRSIVSLKLSVEVGNGKPTDQTMRLRFRAKLRSYLGVATFGIVDKMEMIETS